MLKFKKFELRPSILTAVKFDGTLEQFEELQEWTGGKLSRFYGSHDSDIEGIAHFTVDSDGDFVRCSTGEWIFKDDKHGPFVYSDEDAKRYFKIIV